MEVASFLLVSSVVSGAQISVLFWCREHIDHCFFCNIEIKKRFGLSLSLFIFTVDRGCGHITELLNRRQLDCTLILLCI